MTHLEHATARLSSAIDALQVALHALQGALPGDGAAAHVEIQIIQRVCAEDYRMPAAALWAPGRHEPIATARLLAMSLARDLTPLKGHEIARAFGRHRSLVPHATRTCADRRATDPHFAAHYLRLRQLCLRALAAR